MAGGRLGRRKGEISFAEKMEEEEERGGSFRNELNHNCFCKIIGDKCSKIRSKLGF